MKTDEKRRLWGLLKGLFLIIAAGLVYYIIIRIVGRGLYCPIKAITGKYCPGCGVTRMCMALLSGDIETAVRYNLLLMSLIPVAAVFGTRRAYIYVRTGETEPDRLEAVVIFIVFAVTVAFWIMRNTEAFAFLAPIE